MSRDSADFRSKNAGLNARNAQGLAFSGAAARESPAAPPSAGKPALFWPERIAWLFGVSALLPFGALFMPVNGKNAGLGGGMPPGGSDSIPGQNGAPQANEVILTAMPSDSLLADSIPKDSLKLEFTDTMTQKSAISDPAEFIKSINISDTNTNLDSIYALPPKEIFTISQRARKQPLKIEMQNVLIKSDDLLNGKQTETAAFYKDMNLIKLYRLILDRKSFPDPDGLINSKNFDRLKSVANAVDAVNLELFFRYVHEKDHADKSKIADRASLTLPQIAQFEYHLEISARIAIILARREIIRNSGRLDMAFPESFNIFCFRNFIRDSKRSQMSAPLFWRDKQMIPKLDQNWMHSSEWLNWVFQQDSLAAKPGGKEMDLIIKSAISDFEKSSEYYTDGDIFGNLVADDLRESYLTQKNMIPENSEIYGFDEAARQVLSFNGDCILDSCGAAAKEQLIRSAGAYAQSQGIKETLAAVGQRLKPLVAFGEQTRARLDMNPDDSAYDGTQPRKNVTAQLQQIQR